MMNMIEEAARTNGLSHDSGYTKCHCVRGTGAEGGIADLAAYGSLSRRRARARNF